MEFKLKDILDNTSLISAEQGDKLFSILQKKIKDNSREEIIIDFSGINDLTTAFINNGISRLFSYGDKEYLLKHMKFVGITKKNHIGLLRLSILNAIKMEK
ncbi:STAS-like domain-containing protein [Clostridium sp.]|uniref:STAS-like domain-containing protein n=1 Tax=Clostridium sp. TaxID=1506 RepID=UPI0025BB73AD|nr:STAS-like domain-containing protein [Clostridium sp.]